MSLGREVDSIDNLPHGPATTATRKLVSIARELGAFVQPGSGSVSVRLNDPNGTKQRLTLFVITTGGELYTGWLSDQLQTIGADKGIAARWVASVADLVPGVHPSPKDPAVLSRNIKLHEIEPVLNEFIERLGETIEAILSTAG